MQTGVYQHSGTWTWRCGKCGVFLIDPSPNLSREDARAMYKAHRVDCAGKPSPTAAATPPPVTESEKPVATKATKATKKAAKKKPAAKAKKKGSKKAKRATVSGKGPIWRFAFLKSPKGRDVTPPVSREGKFLAKTAAKRYGFSQAPKWGRIRSKTRKAALAALRAGKGEWFTPKKPEN